VIRLTVMKVVGVARSQKFVSVHASIHNYFNHDRHFNRRNIFKQKRSAVMVDWHQLSV